MSTTDPLREALAALIEEIAGPVGRIRVDSEGTGVGYDADLIAEAIGRGREALAAGSPPMEQDAGYWRKMYEEAIAAVPAEPEAWEYRAVVQAAGRVSERASAPVTSIEAAHATRRSMEDAWVGGGWIERRRPRTAPGPWERVDPEPREGD